MESTSCCGCVNKQRLLMRSHPYVCATATVISPPSTVSARRTDAGALTLLLRARVFVDQLVAQFSAGKKPTIPEMVRGRHSAYTISRE